RQGRLRGRAALLRTPAAVHAGGVARRRREPGQPSGGDDPRVGPGRTPRHARHQRGPGAPERGHRGPGRPGGRSRPGAGFRGVVMPGADMRPAPGAGVSALLAHAVGGVLADGEGTPRLRWRLAGEGYDDARMVAGRIVGIGEGVELRFSLPGEQVDLLLL